MQDASDLQSLQDRYEILTELGQGGMSVVYKARDKTLDRLVALKTLSVRSLTEKQLVQFQAEARALSNLKHKGIMEILDFGSTKSGKPYMVLEYIDGIPLSKYIENVGPLPLILCLQIFSQLCDGLNHAHNKGVLHRDIKPSNIILVSTGKEGYIPKIIDFGLAVLHANESGANINNSAAGSPPYMSPEQIEGKVLDQRSDIYSLGCTLFESLTGKVPYEGANALETMNMHKNAPIPTFSKISDSEVQVNLQNCLNKALAKNKNDRFQFVIALQKVIDEILAQAVEIARQKSKSKNSDSDDPSVLSTKKTIFKWLISIVACLSILFLAFSFIYQDYTKKDTQNAKEESKRTEYVETRHIDQAIQMHEDFGRKEGESKKITTEFLSTFPKDMTEVVFRQDDLENADLSVLKRLKNLEKLRLTTCGITPTHIKQISTLTQLKKLELAGNDLARADFNLLSNLKLKKLQVEGCHLNNKSLLAISKMKTLKELNMNMADGVDAQVVENLTKLPELIELEIGMNPVFTGEALRKLAGFKKLERLGLDAVKLDDETAEYLAPNLNSVRQLSITLNPITLRGLRAFLKMPKLESININGCELQDDDSQDAILILSKTLKRVKIEDQSLVVNKANDH